LVTEAIRGALFRFDKKGRRMDVFGTSGGLRLKTPLGVTVGPDGVIYVADVGIQKVLAFSPEGDIKASYGKSGELTNPTKPAISPDGTRLYVTDSKGQKVVVFDLKSGKIVLEWGKRGEKDGEFNFPSSLAFGQDGNIFVIDQMNARVQLYTPDGAFVDSLGERGIAPGSFVRPKDVAIDEAGLVYVSDAAFGNIQIFDSEFRPLTFVGDIGSQPGRFLNISGVAVQGDRFAAVDQLNRRVQVFQFLGPKTGE
jgi:DNA-binding beta-propeller fold protein YncE